LKRKAAFYTLGCKVNQYETNAMEKLFVEGGYEIVPFTEYADVYVVNTCTVTSVGDKKSRQILRRAKGQNPDAVIAAVGCMAQISPDEVKKLKVADVIIGTNHKGDILDAVNRVIEEKNSITLIDDVLKTDVFEETPLDFFEGRERAYIKIQEGCDRYCSYCIIPYARGAVRSRDEKEILKEAKRLGDGGFCEVVLTGIHVASYGRGSDTNLGRLLQKLSEIESIKRIRMSSIDPKAFTDEFIDILASLPKVCPHFHISLQSGSDLVLKKMNRRYTSDEYYDVLTKLREKIPSVSITTDVITGFPYESEEEFEASCRFVEKCGFAAVHIFPYSERKGTPAAKFPCSVEKSVRAERAKKMAEVAGKGKTGFMQKFIGEKMQVLIEQKTKNGLYEGFTDNYLKTVVSGDLIPGRIYSVTIGEIKGECLVGLNPVIIDKSGK